MKFVTALAILFSCLAVQAADPQAASFEDLGKIVRSSFEEKNPAAFLAQYDFTGTPVELLAVITNSINSSWGKGNWVVTSVVIHPYAGHQPATGVPGKFQGKPLKWNGAPTHWIILKAEAPKDGPPGRMEIEMAAYMKDKRCRLAGPAFE